MPSSIFLLIACQAILMSEMSMLIASSSLVGASLASDPALATVPFGAQFLGMALTTYPASMLMSRVGRRTGFLIGSAIGFCGAAICTYAVIHTSMELFVLGSFLVGSYNGVGQYHRFAAADAVTGPGAAKAISWVVAGGIAAAFIGPNLARYTRDAWPEYLYAGVFVTLMVLTALSAFAYLFLRLPQVNEKTHEGEGRPLSTIAIQPTYVVAVVAATLGYGVMNLLMAATPLAMAGSGHAFDDSAFVIQWHIVAMFLPGFFTGQFINRFGVLKVMATGVVAVLLTVAINLGGDGFWNYWSALVLLGVGWNFLFVSGTFLLTKSYDPQEKARAQGLNDLLVFGTVTFTAFGSGAILYWAGWQSVNLGVLPILAVIVAAIVWLWSVNRRSPVDV